MVLQKKSFVVDALNKHRSQPGLVQVILAEAPQVGVASQSRGAPTSTTLDVPVVAESGLDVGMTVVQTLEIVPE